MDYQQEREFNETVVQINRISKKTKGGNQIRFAALMVLGDRKGRVGMGNAKAQDVRNAIRKSIDDAKKKMVTVTMRGTTIPYSVIVKSGASQVLLKPAPPGTGIVAGGPMRVVLEAAGIRDVVGKSLGSNNKISNVRATIMALQQSAFLMKKKEFQRESGREAKQTKKGKETK